MLLFVSEGGNFVGTCCLSWVSCIYRYEYICLLSHVFNTSIRDAHKIGVPPSGLLLEPKLDLELNGEPIINVSSATRASAQMQRSVRL